VVVVVVVVVVRIPYPTTPIRTRLLGCRASRFSVRDQYRPGRCSCR
jgi:hypothetical protein